MTHEEKYKAVEQAIDPQTLTSLITRLEEEYGKASFQHSDEVTWEVVEASNHIINSTPTLLAALRHYMAVAEAGERLVAGLKKLKPCDPTYQSRGGYYIDNDVDWLVDEYQEAVDTPSN